ncbi:hypothetical protein SEA_PH8S_48 [Mycobacterium phage Ph8s]|nr:hypothetical protein SEA_PH8S_48 [Mycobacterium phage Ph8s]
MPDRMHAVIAVPVDDALPIDVQGVGLRRKAIDLMKEIADVDENTVRYKGATDDATLHIGEGVGYFSLWQHNMIAARFIADGKAKREVVGAVTRYDRDARLLESVSFVRDPHA